MADIFRDDETAIRKEDDCIVISQGDGERRIPVEQLETVAELSPCVTMGRYLDLRVVTIRAKGQPLIYIPVTKEGAKRILTGIQQCKLNAARELRQSGTA